MAPGGPEALPALREARMVERQPHLCLEGSRTALLIGCQHAPGVSGADTHQFSPLIQGNVLREEAVQNLKSGLFFLRQCHILHRVSMTFMLAS